MKKISTLIIASILCFPMLLVIAPHAYAQELDPQPEITYIDYPFQIELGQSVSITLGGVNQGGESPEAYLSISFPDNPSDISIVSSDAPHQNILLQGDTIWGGYGQYQLTASYPLAEVYDLSWTNGEEHYLTVQTTPETGGVFTFYVKMVVKDNDADGWFADPRIDGSESNLLDQQSEFVFEHTINVVGVGIPPDLTLFAPEIDGLTVTVNGVVLPGTPETSIVRIHWNWGDGSEDDQWFPATHTYTSEGSYAITVTAYQSDGLTSIEAKHITLGNIVHVTFSSRDEIGHENLGTLYIARDWGPHDSYSLPITLQLSKGRYHIYMTYLENARFEYYECSGDLWTQWLGEMPQEAFLHVDGDGEVVAVWSTLPEPECEVSFSIYTTDGLENIGSMEWEQYLEGYDYYYEEEIESLPATRLLWEESVRVQANLPLDIEIFYEPLRWECTGDISLEWSDRNTASFNIQGDGSITAVWTPVKEPPFVESYATKNLYEINKLDTFLSQVLHVKQSPIDVNIDVYVGNDELVDYVYLWISNVEPNVYYLEKKETGHYAIEDLDFSAQGLRWEDPAPAAYVICQLLFKKYSGLSLPPFPGFKEPSIPDVRLDEIVIVDTDGIEHSTAISDRLPTYEDAVQKMLPTWRENGGEIYAAACPVDLLVIDPNGNKVGALYEDATFIAEINEIDGAFYFGRNLSLEIISVPFATGDYDIQVQGTGTGEYNLTILIFNHVSVHNISNTIVEGTVHYYTLSVGTEETSLISWEHIFEDTIRGTILKISTEDKYFQFIAPDKNFGIKHDANMIIIRRAIVIRYEDSEMRLITIAVDTKLDFCVAIAWDFQTCKGYYLIDKAGME